MDALGALVEGFRVALTPINLLWALAGVTLGTIVGVLPGIGPALTVALLLPVTFSLPPIEAFIMFAGIYYGGMYGGSTTAILLNTPGESASVMTAVEDHLIARAGRGSKVGNHRRVARSFIGGTRQEQPDVSAKVRIVRGHLTGDGGELPGGDIDRFARKRAPLHLENRPRRIDTQLGAPMDPTGVKRSDADERVGRS